MADTEPGRGAFGLEVNDPLLPGTPCLRQPMDQQADKETVPGRPAPADNWENSAGRWGGDKLVDC